MAGGLKAYMTPQRGDSAGAARNHEGRYGSLEVGGTQGKAGRGSLIPTHSVYIQSSLYQSLLMGGRGNQMPGGGERSRCRGSGHSKPERRGSPYVHRGMDESWRGSGPKRGKEGLLRMGDTPTEQGKVSLTPPKDRADQLACNGG